MTYILDILELWFRTTWTMIQIFFICNFCPWREGWWNIELERTAWRGYWIRTKRDFREICNELRVIAKGNRPPRKRLTDDELREAIQDALNKLRNWDGEEW